MTSPRWTEAEIKAIRIAQSYAEWVRMTASERPYDAWEVKRRRVAANDEVSLLADEDALGSPDSGDALIEKARFSKAVAATERPNLGAPREFPDVIGFDLAFVDLETTNLKGNFGRVLCASVADKYGNVRTFRLDDPLFARDRRRDDVALVVALRDYLEQFDMLVGWYSKMFDIPFLNTRLLIGNERPMRTDIMHLDPIYKARKGSLTLHSARLDAVAKTFRLPVQKTGLDPDIWNDAADGVTEAMDYVVQHCEADVLVLRMVFHILKPLVKVVHR